MEIIKITNKNQKEVVKKAADFIRQGKVVVFPTDTVYGLISDAGNKKAVNRIFQIKKRDNKKSLPIFIKTINIAKNLAITDSVQTSLLKKYWPGKITVILKRKVSKKLYGIDKKNIALRVPKYKPLNELLEKLGFPLVQTSANISGINPITSIKEAILQFNNNHIKPDLLIDGGKLLGKSSKVIDLTVNPYKVLRK